MVMRSLSGSQWLFEFVYQLAKLVEGKLRRAGRKAGVHGSAAGLCNPEMKKTPLLCVLPQMPTTPDR
jgi:hypothetical protein